MTSAFFSLMGGFVITDQERNPVQVLILHSSHLSHDYFKTLVPTITKVDDDTKARLKKLLTDTLSASIIADSTGSNSRGFVDADATVDEIIPLLMAVVFKTVLESELLQVILGHKAVLQLFAMNMATEAVMIAFPNIMEMCNSGMSEDLTRERLVRDKLGDQLRAQLPGRLRGITKTLEMDIRDKSKDDWLGKTLAVAQTTWFITQCIARRAQNLPLTQIELIACAYASLNAVIYLFWWHKPSGVDRPIMLRSQIPHEVRKVDKITSNRRHLVSDRSGGEAFRRQLRVPILNHGCLYDGIGYHRRTESAIVGALIAVVFGGIHLFAWNYEFFTQGQSQLWHVSTLTIVGIPMLYLILHIFIFCIMKRSRSRLFFFISLPYIIARCTLLILSLVSLRQLPVGALSNVDWLSFIPHID